MQLVGSLPYHLITFNHEDPTDPTFQLGEYDSFSAAMDYLWKLIGTELGEDGFRGSVQVCAGNTVNDYEISLTDDDEIDQRYKIVRV